MQIFYNYLYYKLSENFNSYILLKELIMFEWVKLFNIIILSQLILIIYNIIMKNV